MPNKGWAEERASVNKLQLSTADPWLGLPNNNNCLFNMGTHLFCHVCVFDFQDNL